MTEDPKEKAKRVKPSRNDPEYYTWRPGKVFWGGSGNRASYRYLSEIYRTWIKVLRKQDQVMKKKEEERLDEALICGESGRVYYFDGFSDVYPVETEHEIDGRCMGCDLLGEDVFYYATRSSLNKCEFDKSAMTTDLITRVEYDHNPIFHQISIIKDRLYATATLLNIIIVTDLDFEHQEEHVLKYPRYSHINNIYGDEDYLYVSMGQFVGYKHGPSGVLVLDYEFNEIGRFPYGYCAHGFCIVGGKKIAISNKPLPDINFDLEDEPEEEEKLGCLLVDEEPVFKFEDNGIYNYFFKDLSIGEEYIYLVGGDMKKSRNDRKTTGAIIVAIDRETYDLVDRIEFDGFGALIGMRLLGKDYSKPQV